MQTITVAKTQPKLYKYLLMVIITISSVNQLLAQRNDYFITWHNDTVKCYLEAPAYLFGKPHFKYHTPATGLKRVDADTLKEFSIDNAVYTARLLPGDTSMTFVNWVYRGKIDLYELYTSSGKYYSYYFYASKGSQPVMEVKTNQFFGSHKERVQKFYELLSDAPELLEKFKSRSSYAIEDIKNAIVNYNEYFGTLTNYFIDNGNNLVRCRFIKDYDTLKRKTNFFYRSTGHSNYQPITLDTLKEYSYRDSVFTKRKLPTEPDIKFVRLVQGGKLNLYEYSYSKNGRAYFASKGNDILQEIGGRLKSSKMSKQDQQAALCSLIADDAPLAEQFKNAFVDDVVLLETVEQYNKRARLPKS